LQGERGKEILVAVTHDEKRMAQRAIRIGLMSMNPYDERLRPALAMLASAPAATVRRSRSCLAHVEVSSFL